MGALFFFFSWTVLAQSIREFERPPGGGCRTLTFVVVAIEVNNDLGVLGNDALVSQNIQVRLLGTAERETLNRDCEPISSPIPFRWALSFEPPGGAPVDESGRLQGRSTLGPTFIANRIGVYTARLSGAGQSAVKRIVVQPVPPGGGWVSIGPTNIAGHINATAIDAVTGNIFAGAESGGVWRSADGGNSWGPLTDRQLPTLKIWSLVLARPGGSPQMHVYAGTDSGGIFHSGDGGSTWGPAGADRALCSNGFLSQAIVNRIAVHPADANKLYAATDRGVFRTEDGGVCWQMVSAAFLNQNVSDLVISRSSPPLIYAGVWNVGVYRASDSDPNNWTLLNARPGSALLPADPFFTGSGIVSPGDWRLLISQQDVAQGIPRSGTTAAAGDRDLSRPLVGFVVRVNANQNIQEYHTDPNRNLVFDAGDVVYRHLGPDVPACPFWG